MGKVIDLQEWKKERDKIESEKIRNFWYNFIIEDDNEEEIDADELLKEIEDLKKKYSNKM